MTYEGTWPRRSSSTRRPHPEPCGSTTTVELDDTGGYSGCSGFVAESTPYSGTLLDFTTTKVDYASGVGVWTPSGSGQTRVYRVSYVLDPATPDSAEGTSAAVTLIWEAQNT